MRGGGGEGAGGLKRTAFIVIASIMAANMWKNSLKNVESVNNKILYETLLDFLQRNGTYFLNKHRTCLLFQLTFELSVMAILISYYYY